MDSSRKETLIMNSRKSRYQVDNSVLREFKINRSAKMFPESEDARELLASCDFLRKQRTEEVRARLFESISDFEHKKLETKQTMENAKLEIQSIKSEIKSGEKEITQLDASNFKHMVEAEQRKLRKIQQENATKKKLIKDLLKEEKELKKSCRNKYHVILKSKIESGNFRMQLYFTHIDPQQPDDQFLIEIMWHLDDQYKMVLDGAEAVSEIDESDFDELVKQLVQSQDLATFVKELRLKWTKNLDAYRTPKADRKVRTAS